MHKWQLGHQWLIWHELANDSGNSTLDAPRKRRLILTNARVMYI